MLPLLLFLGSAALRGLAQPGWLSWPLVLLAAALRILSWRQPTRRAALWDLAHGLTFWLFAFSFLSEIHPIAVVTAAVVMAPLGWVEGWLARRLQRWTPLPLAGACALAATAWLQMEFFLLGVGGVPWASWAWPLANSPLLPLASALGESGLIALVLLAGAGLAALALRRWRDPVVFAAPALWLVGALAVAPLPVASGSLRCLAVQGCIRVEDKARAHLDPIRFFQRQLDVTREGLAGGQKPQLVLWAETMFPFPVVDPALPPGLVRQWFPGYGFEDAPSAAIEQSQRRLAMAVLSGAPPDALFATGVHFYRPLPDDAEADALAGRSSSTVVFRADGVLLGHLDKSELVPFGERLPLGGDFPGAAWLAQKIQEGSGLRPDFLRPDQHGPLLAEGLPPLGFATCWENVFPTVFRRQADRGAQAFIVLSNEDWYGDDSREMAQMVAATRLRAVETRRAVLRVTNTGHTLLVGADGALQTGPEIGVPAAWNVDLPLVPPSTRTRFQRAGHWLLPLLAAVTAILALAPRRSAPDSIDRPPRAG